MPRVRLSLGVILCRSPGNGKFSRFPPCLPDPRCAFAGGATGPGPVLDLVNRAQAILPGANPAYQQIIVDAAGSFNRVEITLCWKTASDAVPRRHTVVTYVN